MRGYFHDEKSTSEVLSQDGWLNTGDIGYRIDDHLVITSRSKDVIIIKGRNIWPYDLEVLAQQTCGVKLGGVAAFSVSAPTSSILPSGDSPRSTMKVRSNGSPVSSR